MSELCSARADRRWSVATIVLALAAALAGCQPARALSDVTAADIAKGTTITRSACLSQTNAVWVEHARGDVCIRYYVAGRPAAERDLVVFFDGDIGYVDASVMRVEDVSRPEIMSARAHQKAADELSRALAQVVVVVARPGLGGSSGWHG
ncbi:MAG TPA: hypothetical protein VHN20_03225, partial [Beijerinckiaceae bacterium]|nr:hypothetical protein [Beijerinckiaceae bacterium]